MTETARLRLPVLAAAQAQKHVTHNEALAALDTLVQASVLDKDLTAPPGSPAEGDCYIVAGAGGTATGAWTSWEKRIARFQDGQWISFLPGVGNGAGWLVWVMDEDAMYRFDGTVWDPAGIEGPQGPEGPAGADGQGVEPDATGTLAERDAYDDEAQGFVYLRTDVSSFTLYVKASATSGDWAGPSPIGGGAGGGRELLTADRTYYVRTDGSDSNDGLGNSAGGAFLTLQKAANVIVGLDLGGYNVTVQIGDGTYTGGVLFSTSFIGGNVTFQGNAGTPANVVVSTTSASCFKITAPLLGILTIKDLKMQTTTSGSCIEMAAAGHVKFGNVNFGATATYHVYASRPFAKIEAISSYTIAGGAGFHYIALLQGHILINAAITVTLSGTPAFTSAFAAAYQLSALYAVTVTFSGSATGKRYDVSMTGLIQTAGGGASYFPGNAAGTTATQGLYQ